MEHSEEFDTCTFLYYGYGISGEFGLPIRVPDPPPAIPFSDRASLVAEGTRMLRSTMEQTYAANRFASIHVVPLSGGLDSRAILAWLREAVDSSKLFAVTFGTPGTWDFEIGRLVAQKAGIKHESIDLTKVEWSTEHLVSFAKRCEQALPVFEAYLGHQSRLVFGVEPLYWSGILADTIAGKHIYEKDSESWEEARARFAASARRTASTILTPQDFDPRSPLPGGPLLPADLLSYDDQLRLAVRGQHYLRPLLLLPGYLYATPYLCLPWTSFMLNVPRSFQRYKQIYPEVLKRAYPELFSWPTKNHAGLPLDAPPWQESLRRTTRRATVAARRLIPWLPSSVPLQTNYIDFDECLRTRQDFKQVVYENLEDLKERKLVPWIDLPGIWERHQRRKENCANILLVLASLEINLKARVEQRRGLQVPERSRASSKKEN